MTSATAIQPIYVSDRQLWLSRAAAGISAYTTSMGLPKPDHVQVRVGPTTTDDAGLLALGHCVPAGVGGVPQPVIVVSELLRNRVTILAVLVHEFIHAADNCVSRHGEWFAGWAEHLGLVGPLPSTGPGPALTARLLRFSRYLGKYPDPEPGLWIGDEGTAFV